MKTLAEVLASPVVLEIATDVELEVPVYVRTFDGELHEVDNVKWATIKAVDGECEVIVLEAGDGPATEVFA